MASPRDLDPKFKEEKQLPPNEANPPVEETEKTEEQRKVEEHDDDTPMLVHRERVINQDGSLGEKVHGPMPVTDWPAYEKENEL